MKAILICPSDRSDVAGLAERVPLSNLPILGKPVIEYWLEHLATRGVNEVHVLAADRPEVVRNLIGCGLRWGLHAVVHPESRELTQDEAFTKYCSENSAAWISSQQGIFLMDRLPGPSGEPLFDSYSAYFCGLWESHSRFAVDRVGMCEIQAGVWAGRHACIAPTAELQAPCWIGEDVFVGAGATVGPWAAVEDRAMIEPGAEIVEAMIGPDTVVGEFAEIRQSIAWGSILVNWRSASCIEVPDDYLLCPLVPHRPPFTFIGLFGRIMAAAAAVLTLPLALLPMVTAKLRGQPVLSQCLAARTRPLHAISMAAGTLRYLELAEAAGWLRRWPQLWSVARGDFGWVGNRPVTPDQAACLENNFERLWLDAPIGLISLADVEGCHSFADDESRVHSSYYATQASWWLDLSILARAAVLIIVGVPYSRMREALSRVIQSIPGTHRRVI